MLKGVWAGPKRTATCCMVCEFSEFTKFVEYAQIRGEMVILIGYALLQPDTVTDQSRDFILTYQTVQIA